jgi:thiamine-monophosphate kinase
MNEFDLIQKYFTRPMRHTDLGIGDDAALLTVAEGMQLVVSTDMSVAGTHFFHDAAPYDIGWKSLAVNVSDMAAMGAQSKWATLAIALPAVEERWLSEFSCGFFACAEAFNIDLIGGDTTRGPLNISVTIMGEVPKSEALKRSGAQMGDDIWISGTLGGAALALACLKDKTLQGKIKLENDALQAIIHALCRPMPRATLGLSINGIATSCIDISDGLVADLGHILKASGLGAKIDIERLPMSAYHVKNLHESLIQQCVLAGGDDYELCFTASPSNRAEIRLLSQQQNIPLTCIASTYKPVNPTDSGVQPMLKHTPLSLLKHGFDHFA